MHSKIFLLVLFIGTASASFAKELPANILQFKDSTGKYSIQDVITHSEYFKPSSDRSPNLVHSNGTLWVKIHLPKLKEPIAITIENAHLDYLSCYIFKQQQLVRIFATGDLQKFNTRDVNSNLFTFICYPGEETVIFKANTSGTLALPLRIHSLSEYFVYDRTNQIILWTFMGIAIVAFAANMFFFFALKDKIYLYYSLYVLANIVYSSVDLELIFQYLSPDFPGINRFNAIFYSFHIFVVIFCDKFLELKKYKPFLHKLLLSIIIFQIFGAIYSLIDYKSSLLILNYVYILIPVLIFVSAILVYIKNKNKVVLLFLFAWILYLSGMFVYIACVIGLVTYYSSISNIVTVFSSLEMVLVFVIVVFKVSHIKEENILTKVQVIGLLTEKEKMLEEQNHILEETVKLRTRDLQIKNEEIMSQNEEINSQNEILLNHQTLLEKQNDIIDTNNRELTIYKEHLEDTVLQRTTELKDANSSLDQKNKQLEQFAFMAAHNLRAPVASVMGLASLIDYDTPIETQKEVVKRIELSMKKLDLVVKSLTSILSDPKVALKLFENCELDKFVKESRYMLESELRTTEASITCDFSACKNLSTVKAYMQNLFYNMLSNAIKYSKEGTKPRIEIKSVRVGDHVQIIFKDYGIGIDLEKHENELFTPFKKFTATIAGIGIGLYLVKTQIEALGGSITVESKLNEGTTFTVTLSNSFLS